MFAKPEEIIKNFDLKKGMIVADFGCGYGHYAIGAAKKVENTGVVYAIDVQKNLLEAVKSEAEKKHLGNLEIIWSDIEKERGSRLAENFADFVIISNILFQSDNPSIIAKEAFRILKKGGKAAVIDWSKSLASPEKNLHKIMPEREAREIFAQEGFAVAKEFSAGENHYGIIFRK